MYIQFLDFLTTGKFHVKVIPIQSGFSYKFNSNKIKGLIFKLLFSSEMHELFQEKLGILYLKCLGSERGVLDFRLFWILEYLRTQENSLEMGPPSKHQVH
jgi:hypothetical protein